MSKLIYDLDGIRRAKGGLKPTRDKNVRRGTCLGGRNGNLDCDPGSARSSAYWKRPGIKRTCRASLPHSSMIEQNIVLLRPRRLLWNGIKDTIF